MVPIQGINWPVVVPVTTSWDRFQSIITSELGTSTKEIKLSYRFSSFTASDNAEVLCSHDYFQKMIAKAKEFLTGKCKVRGGREFRVHLDPGFKEPPSTTTEASALKKGTGKVSHVYLWSLAMVMTHCRRRENWKERWLVKRRMMRWSRKKKQNKIKLQLPLLPSIGVGSTSIRLGGVEFWMMDNISNFSARTWVPGPYGLWAIFISLLHPYWCNFVLLELGESNCTRNASGDDQAVGERTSAEQTRDERCQQNKRQLWNRHSGLNSYIYYHRSVYTYCCHCCSTHSYCRYCGLTSHRYLTHHPTSSAIGSHSNTRPPHVPFYCPTTSNGHYCAWRDMAEDLAGKAGLRRPAWGWGQERCGDLWGVRVTQDESEEEKTYERTCTGGRLCERWVWGGCRQC